MAAAQDTRFQEVVLTRSPQLVLDPRDWFASWHGVWADLVPDNPDDPTVKRTPAVVRPNVPLTAIAGPPTPPDPRWPFPGEVELALNKTPTGLLAFFGRVRVPNGPLRRLPLRATTCKLTVTGPGFAPWESDSVSIPGPDGPITVVRIDLVPGPDYSFPIGPQPNGNAGPTLLVGNLLETDGTAVPSAVVAAANQPNLVPTLTNDLGGWVLVLDQKTDRNPVPTPIDVTFAPPGQPAVTLAGVAFQPGTTNRVKQTSLRGVVRAANGTAVAGAVVSVTDFPVGVPARPRTQADGTWVYYLGLGEPSPTDPQLVAEPDPDNPDDPNATVQVRPVTVHVEAPGRPAVDVPVRMVVGRPTQVDTITV
jgi:hypothetical protein